jgi:hypothetical protein
MRVYTASSWRNESYPDVVAALRGAGHDIFDFRNPRPGDHGFSWSDVDPGWQRWTRREYIVGLNHPIARQGFASNMGGIKWAEAVVLILPCGRSAHLELGWAAGAGKRTAILLGAREPELMYRMVDAICSTLSELLAWLSAPVGRGTSEAGAA